MKLIIKSRSGTVKKEYTQFQPSSTIGALKQRFEQDFGTNIHRQRFTFIKAGCNKSDKKNQIALTDNAKTFQDYNLIALNNGNTEIELIYKDLGPQISWRTVFLVEYFGPMLMHLLPYALPTLFYPQPEHPEVVGHKSLTQKIALGMIVVHYLKREFETVFVHRFSAATMPLFNIFKNCFHYWILGGICISYFLYHPQYTPAFEHNPKMIYAITGMWAFCECMNLDAHVRLKNLRPPGTRKRGIPRGQLFEMVSCANYFWEICGWFWFSMLTSCATGWLFYGAGAVQMYFWAAKKHKNYRKEFADYPRRRTALIPFIL